MQVPSITLEDLQTFQANHFPGPHNPLISPTAEPTENYANDEDDDLGYYADGAKRTLTDEQIKIFRHSEVHALLRARQLEQDEAEYEARRRNSSSEVGEESADEGDGSARIDEGTMQKEGKAGSELQSSVNRESEMGTARQAKDSTSESLDYGGHEESADRQLHAKTQVQYSGRKVVSYAD